MKLFAEAVMVAGTVAWARDGARTPERVITVCMNTGADGSLMYRGEATATRILKQAGIQLNWRGDERACAEGDGIVVSVSRETPADRHPGALAYARPFDRTSIVLFFDRVLGAAGPAVTAVLLGHVLAHEIVHKLQACEHHTTSGVMKPRWDKQDYSEMQRKPLTLTAEDLVLIGHGLEWRAGRGLAGE